MERIYLLFIISGLLLENGLHCGASVFLPRHAADSVLRRHRRYNQAFEEMVNRDNLERECIEERCSWEEAREVFENKEKTREFWVRYTDGDQCESSPCKNGGACKDGMASYTCWCVVGYTGKNCEIETVKQCDIGNGGCMHFCKSDKFRGVSCECAPGYRLAQDRMTCEPEGKFPCGKLRVDVNSATSVKSFHVPPLVRSINPPLLNTSEETSAPLNTSEETSAPLNITEETLAPTANATTPPSNDTTGMNPRMTKSNLDRLTFFPTMFPALPEQKTNERIVGGTEAEPGEIPWQVALIHRPKMMVICGGAILGEQWVITAAHCQPEGQENLFFVRVGEHHVHKDEGTERDHEIASWHPHPSYNKLQSKFNHDIALLKLETPITFSDFALPVCLGPKDFTEQLVQTGPVALVSGWGMLRHEGAQSPVLRKVEVPYVDRKECKESSSDRVTRFMFCAGYATQRKDACQGDSGGPHVIKHGGTWFLTGIISWGEECAKEGKYGIYTRVSRYSSWISYVIGLGNDSFTSDQYL